MGVGSILSLYLLFHSFTVMCVVCVICENVLYCMFKVVLCVLILSVFLACLSVGNLFMIHDT